MSADLNQWLKQLKKQAMEAAEVEMQRQRSAQRAPTQRPKKQTRGSAAKESCEEHHPDRREEERARKLALRRKDEMRAKKIERQKKAKAEEVRKQHQATFDKAEKDRATLHANRKNKTSKYEKFLKKSPKQIGDAFVLGEILGPPVAFKGWK